MVVFVMEQEPSKDKLHTTIAITNCFGKGFDVDLILISFLQSFNTIKLKI